MIADPWFYVFAALAVLLTGISKGGFAGTFGGVGVPLMSLAISPVQAAGIMLPILLAMDAYGLRVFWRHFDRTVLGTMLLGGLLGTVMGYFAFGKLNEHGVRVLIGLIAVGFPILTQTRNWLARRAARAIAPLPLSHGKGGFWCTFSGFTSFVAHSGGAPYQVYAMPLQLDKLVYTATAALFFAYINALKIPFYAVLGQFSVQNMLAALVLCPLVPVGIHVGLWLQKKVKSDAQFYLIGQGLLFTTGCKLLWDGARGLGAF